MVDLSNIVLTLLNDVHARRVDPYASEEARINYSFSLHNITNFIIMDFI